MFENIVKNLLEKNKTISTMESCTGGCVANEITNISGASEILKFSAVTYSNEFKIKMGVNEDIIKEFTVYSMEVAKEMSKKISEFTNSNYGVGVTGRINKVDNSNPVGGDAKTIYISIFDKDNNKYYENEIKAIYNNREDNKKYIVKIIIEMLENILK